MDTGRHSLSRLSTPQQPSPFPSTFGQISFSFLPGVLLDSMDLKVRNERWDPFQIATPNQGKPCQWHYQWLDPPLACYCLVMHKIMAGCHVQRATVIRMLQSLVRILQSIIQRRLITWEHFLDFLTNIHS